MATTIETEEGAKRWAKTILQDISLYNTDKIQEGLKNDSIFEVLADELKEGKMHYENRVAPTILASTNYYDRAINDILIKDALMKTQGNIDSKIA